MSRTNVCLVLDQSGSMYSIRRETQDAFNKIVDSIKDGAEKNNQTVSVSTVTFDNSARVVFRDQPPEKAYLTNYNPDGMTALWDGVGKAIDILKDIDNQWKPGVKGWINPFDPDRQMPANLVLVVTDGVENVSRVWTASRLQAEMKSLQLTNRWSFAFNVPPKTGAGVSAKESLIRFGIPTDNIREWEATQEGVKETEEKTSAAIGGYFEARSRGLTATKSFYKMATDLSGLDIKKVASALTDLSHRFRSFTVTAESDIEAFVTGKTKKPYVKGSTYYQLMKPEKVQSDKAILIQEKGKKAIWGGAEARKLIGLPEDKDARVTPGNHGNFDIYIQSHSVNRKLVRGTKVLVERS